MTDTEVIITDLKFQVNGFKGKDYNVHVWTVDETETDDYDISITNVLDNEDTYMFHCDSCGGLVDDSWVLDNDICRYVCELLFTKNTKGIIQGF